MNSTQNTPTYAFPVGTLVSIPAGHSGCFAGQVTEVVCDTPTFAMVAVAPYELREVSPRVAEFVPYHTRYVDFRMHELRYRAFPGA